MSHKVRIFRLSPLLATHSYKKPVCPSVQLCGSLVCTFFFFSVCLSVNSVPVTISDELGNSFVILSARRVLCCELFSFFPFLYLKADFKCVIISCEHLSASNPTISFPHGNAERSVLML